MFRNLIESIRTEATQRGSLRGAYVRSPGTSKTVKKGAARFLRQTAKRELQKVKKDPSAETNIPRRGISGWSD
jgi:hypothetical protein